MTRQPRIGDNLFVEWYGSWYPGEVIGLNADGTVRVHYTGWGSEFDESVAAGRLSWTQATVSQPALPRMGPGPVYWDSLDRFLLGEPVTSASRLRAGDHVHVKWHGSWWAAEVRQVQSDGSVTVHYTGWDDCWNETVSRDRMQLPARGDRSVTFHLDRGWTVVGQILEILPDSFVVSRAEDHRVCVIRKEQVRYFELHQAPQDYVQGIRSHM